MTRTKRCSTCAFAALAILACFGPPIFAQGTPTGTPVYTLESDEEILDPESTIAMSAEAADVILVLAKGEEKILLISCSAMEKRRAPMPRSGMR